MSLIDLLIVLLILSWFGIGFVAPVGGLLNILLAIAIILILIRIIRGQPPVI